LGATIVRAQLYLYGAGKSNELGETDLVVVGSTPASNTNVVAGDYTRLGNVEYGSITWRGFSIGATNAIDLSPAAITPGGITGLGLRLRWDQSGSFTGVWKAGSTTDFSINFAEAGLNGPYLQVVYSLPTPMALSPIRVDRPRPP
jgi:hypothetical protein